MSIKKRKNGFVILYAVIVAVVVATVAAALMNIIARQLIISSVSRDSKIVFYAAMSGYDCAKFWMYPNDRSNNYLGDLNDGAYLSPDHSNIFCNNTDIETQTDPAAKTTSFYLDIKDLSGSTNKYCALVTVTTNPDTCDSNLRTVRSVGYSLPCSIVKNSLTNGTSLPSRTVIYGYNDITSCPPD